MAKVNTNKARKIAGVRVDMPDEQHEGGFHWGNRWRYVLRSDGTVLRSFQCAIKYEGRSPYWGSPNYKVLGKLKDDVRLAGKFDLVAFAWKRHPNAIQVVED